MDLIYVSFSLKSFSCTDSDSFEVYYSEVLKPLIKFLNKNPEFHFSFSFSGTEIAYFKKRKNEFLKVLSELVKRNQCEIYGGAYYKPVLPLLLPSDRNGQIDLLTSEIRQYTGKAPRGLCLYNDVWDSSLLQTLNSCGMDYVILNESIFPEDKRKFLSVQMSELGKSRQIYGFSDSIKQEFLENTSADFIKSIQKKVSKANNSNPSITSENKNIVNIALSKADVKAALQNELFGNFLNEIKNQNANVVLATISEYSKLKAQKIPAFISSGICPKMNITGKFSSVYDFMNANPRSQALYNRMLYVSQLVNQPNKDKAHQRLAREKLWEGQNGDLLVCTAKTTSERQASYKKLMEAENIIRETSENKESVLSFDYNYDGYPEYVCRMENYFSCISLKGGAVQDFQSIKNTGNYADNYSRASVFGDDTDGYERGLFIDHLFTEDQFQKYLNKEAAGEGIFSQVLYEEVKFSAKHHELLLKARANFGNQPVSITKKYTINSSGMNIQYILKNESEVQLKSKFCVESNFAQVDFTPENTGAYKVLVATETEAREIDTEKTSLECFENGAVHNINVVQITDDQNGISFSFEPNENCSYCFYPLTFIHKELEKALGMTYVSTLFWDVDIAPGKEIEKNFNFTIFSPHKTRKKSVSKN